MSDRNRKKWERIDSDRAPCHAEAYEEGKQDGWESALQIVLDKVSDIDASDDAAAAAIERAMDAIRAVQQADGA